MNTKDRERRIQRLMSNTGPVVPGSKPYTSPRFIAVRLSNFPIPPFIRDALLDTNVCTMVDRLDALRETTPYLFDELTFKTYKSIFHGLLYLEEMETVLEIARHDKDEVRFRPSSDGDCLVMDMPGLFESRPSLVIGDKVVAKQCNADIISGEAGEFGDD